MIVLCLKRNVLPRFNTGDEKPYIRQQPDHNSITIFNDSGKTD